MPSPDAVRRAAQQWSTLLGRSPRIDPALPGRELWPVTAEDGRRYLLKRLGPWLNLPIADQARVLVHLARHGIEVAEFLIADDARIVAGPVEHPFVLMPHRPHDRIDPSRSLEVERDVGRTIARLHAALSVYPWPANSYREQIVEGLEGELLLPGDVQELLAPRRDTLAAALAPLPLQLVHGDLTPDNVLITRATGSAAVIDLDHLPLAPRIWDLGKYLSRRLRRLPGPAALANVTRLVAGYHRSSALTEQELHALPAAIAVMHALEASWTQRILSGQLERRLLPEQRAELAPTLEALRHQLRDDRPLAEAVRSGADGPAGSDARAGGHAP
ncbi:phosphotransferase enzyme family protein [Brachybacterium sp. YJGR34]|uniref:phosphotransferase enzyme family protein n=1 Tax=Brachybacterium sp. YJGR34 TaxID=2059911 RepID=UPI000E0C8DA3|nr:phosphotransferase [Brachybacterium sp. YJGR34]